MIDAAVTPFVLCSDLSEALAFYEALGFDCGVRSDEQGYAYIRATSGAIRLLQTGLDLSDERREQMVYVDVPDVDAWWEDRRAFLEALPEGRARAPFDRHYGQREAHVIHEATLLMFGTVL